MHEWCEAFGYQLKNYRGMALFGDLKFEVMDNKVLVLQDRKSTPAAGQPASGPAMCHMTLLTCRMTLGRKLATYIDRLDANWHSNRHSNPDDVGIVFFQDMTLTFIYLWVDQYKCDNSLWQFDISPIWLFLAVNSIVFISQGKCLAKWTWYSQVDFSCTLESTVTMLIR